MKNAAKKTEAESLLMDAVAYGELLEQVQSEGQVTREQARRMAWYARQIEALGFMAFEREDGTWGLEAL